MHGNTKLKFWCTFRFLTTIQSWIAEELSASQERLLLCGIRYLVVCVAKTIQYVTESERQKFCAGVCCGFCGRISQGRHILVSRKTIIVTKKKYSFYKKAFLNTNLHVPTLGGAQNLQTYRRHICTPFYERVATQWRVRDIVNLEPYMIGTKTTSARFVAPVEDAWRNEGTAPTALELRRILR